MPPPRRFLTLIVLFSALSAPSAVKSADWVHWRGPEQNGYSKEKGLPNEFGVDQPGKDGLIWKQPYGGRSSPLLLKGRLYAIGGNVNHAVTLSVVATDTKGRPLTDSDVIGAHRWFAVLKPRAGGKVAHDLDGTPTVQMLYRDYARYAGARRGQPPVPVQARGARAKPADAASP